MKILVENYKDLYSTESMYLHGAMRMAQCESYIWDTSVYSAYDIIDMVQPEVLLLKWSSSKLNDVLKYIKNNSKSPDIIINVTGADENFIKYLKLKSKFLFTNNYFQYVNSENAIELIMPGADLFIPPISIPEYQIDAAICYENFEKYDHDYESYHYLHFGTFNEKNCDLNVTLINLASLYSRYKNFVLFGDLNFIFSQIFFDANFRSNKVVLKNKEQDFESLRNILGHIFSFDLNENIDMDIKQQIKTQHTCLNRCQQVLKLLNNTSAIEILDREINKNV